MIRKASIDDIAAIRALAEVVFPATYRDILSAEQLEYMMEWMYSEESLRRQMLERGDVFLIEEGKGYASYRPDGIFARGNEASGCQDEASGYQDEASGYQNDASGCQDEASGCQNGIFSRNGVASGVPGYHLEKLYVLPQWQGTGLGRRLFEAVVSEVRRAAGNIPGDGGDCPEAGTGCLPGGDCPEAGTVCLTSGDSPEAGTGCLPGGVRPVPVRLELNVNRNNPAVAFYEHLGMRRDRSGDFPIGNGFYMNDYIMAVDL